MNSTEAHFPRWSAKSSRGMCCGISERASSRIMALGRTTLRLPRAQRELRRSRAAGWWSGYVLSACKVEKRRGNQGKLPLLSFEGARLQPSGATAPPVPGSAAVAPPTRGTHASGGQRRGQPRAGAGCSARPRAVTGGDGGRGRPRLKGASKSARRGGGALSWGAAPTGSTHPPVVERQVGDTAPPPLTAQPTLGSPHHHCPSLPPRPAQGPPRVAAGAQRDPPHPWPHRVVAVRGRASGARRPTKSGQGYMYLGTRPMHPAP
eukprot:scaffold1182_cov396-Prasinococcus_capsulatus_cf.AAC.4